MITTNPTACRTESIVASRSLIALLVLASAFLCSCEPRRRALNIGPPRVYPPLVSRKTLQVQSDRTVAAARQLSASQLNQMRAGRQTIEMQFGVQAARTGVDVPAAVAATAPTLPAAPVGAPAAADFGPLLSEGLDDLTAKEADIEGVRLLYAGDASIDAKARLYLVSFDVWLNPLRQNYLAYPILAFGMDFDGGVPPTFTGLRNYRKDYQAEVVFTLPAAKAGKNAPVEVYAVQPANQNLTALDSVASAQQIGLTAAFAQAAWGAQADYRDRIEEQFAEQRKFPLIQGVIDSATQFRFVFNPRRRTVRRSPLVSWIPGVGRYTTKLFLEAGVRRVYAYLLVRNPAEVESRAGEFPAGFATMVSQYVPKGQRESIEARGKEKPDNIAVSDGKATVPLSVRGSYIHVDDPYRRDRIQFERGGDASGLPEEERTVEAALPLGAEINSVGWNVSADAPDLGNIVKLDPVGGGHRVDYDALSATVYGSSDGGKTFHVLAAKIISLGAEGGKGTFEIAPLPKKPTDPSKYQLRLHIKAGVLQGWSNDLPYRGPWAEDAGPVATSGAAGKGGAALSMEIPRKVGNTTITTVRAVLFGENQAKVIESEAKDGQPFKIKVIVPESRLREVELFAEVDGSEPDGEDPQILNATKNVTKLVKLGTFTYT